MTEIILSQGFINYLLSELYDMKGIEFLGKFTPDGLTRTAKDIEVRRIFEGEYCQILEITLYNHAILPKHKAGQPITVFCSAGRGKFFAGADLEEEQILEAGVLLTLESGIEHGAAADPDLRILVTKFM